MALRKQDVVVGLSSHRAEPVALCREVDEASLLPRPLLNLYNQASLFLDKQAAVYDHYWAVGIHKAIHKAFPEFAELRQKARPTIKRSASNKSRNRKPSTQQLALELPADNPPGPGVATGDGRGAPFRHRFERAVSMQVDQRVVLISAIWSTRNRMTIESGTWGRIAEVGSTIKVKWELPFFRKRLWDRFRPDDYLDYFEEEKKWIRSLREKDY